MGTRLLPACRGLAAPAGNPVPRSGTATFAVFGLSDRTDSIRADIPGPEDAGALGGALGPSVRGRSLDCSPTHADAWHPVSGRIRMRSMIGSVIFGWLFLGTWCAPASADGGSLRLSGKKGGYQITVFTAPTPFRAGPVDISVLVQDASTGDLVTQARVIVRMTKSGRPALEYPATTEAATNKLFRAAQFELPEPGRWEMQVEVEGVAWTGSDRRRDGSGRAPAAMAGNVAMDWLARAGDRSVRYSSNVGATRRTINFILPAVRTDTLSKSPSMRETRMHAGAAVQCLDRIQFGPFAASLC